MNILQVAVLLAITLKCVTASNLTSSELEGAKEEQQEVTGTASISSTVENDLLLPFSSQLLSTDQLLSFPQQEDLTQDDLEFYSDKFDGLTISDTFDMGYC